MGTSIWVETLESMKPWVIFFFPWPQSQLITSSIFEYFRKNSLFYLQIKYKEWFSHQITEIISLKSIIFFQEDKRNILKISFLHSHHGWEGIGFMWKMTRKFHQIFTFWDPLSPKKGFLWKCLSVGRVRLQSR